MDKYRIDSHKLMFHPQRVSDWLSGKLTYPIYVEISPSGACNHRCTFCALDFMGYRNRFLDTGILKIRLSEMGALGVRSVMFGGEGEPLLHRDIGLLTRHAAEAGMDVAATTNGVLFDSALAENMLPHLKWIKFSVNAGSKDLYARIHRTRASDFDRVTANLAQAARIKHQNGFNCTLGVQILLLPENRTDIFRLAETARNIGMDYLVVKPYSQHPKSKTNALKDLKYHAYLKLSQKLAQYHTDGFQVVFRTNAMHKWDDGRRSYSRCLALPFWAYIDAGGTVWGCSAHMGDQQFNYGNILQDSFQELWEGERRSASLQWVQNDLNAHHCRVNCRMDEINRYLWELQNPGEHVNFI